ncbi:MAG TPA: hypothetical protein PK431_01540 [Chitinophagales bacterium]|nr:hypothetical protein [Chitinophagales bacterium]
MKKFSASVNVKRTTGVDTLVTTSGDFNREEVREAFGVAKEAIESSDEEGATYSGSVTVWDDEVEASTESIMVTEVRKATMLEFASFMETPATEETPVPPTPTGGEDDGN